MISIALANDIFSIPTITKYECLLVDFICEWASMHGVKLEVDSYGNVYLTKGDLRQQGEYYPCVTAHLDTVHNENIPFIANNKPLPIKVVKKHGRTILSCDGVGIGGDDKAGVLICLSLLKRCETLKVVFFVEEEGGAKGSKHLHKGWFDDVGYVIGFDSPELNRAAYSSKGNRLFSKSFFKEEIKDICAKHGVTDFRSEPNTDVRRIREKVPVQCMNFGCGYYLPHTTNEYVVLEEMSAAAKMGEALIQHLGDKCYYYRTHTAYLKYMYYDFKKLKKKFKKRIVNDLTNFKTKIFGIKKKCCIFASC